MYARSGEWSWSRCCNWAAGQRYLVGAGGDSVQSIAEMREPLAANYVSIAMSEATDTGRENAAMQGSGQEARCSC
jgi:hypothetical protein